MISGTLLYMHQDSMRAGRHACLKSRIGQDQLPWFHLSQCTQTRSVRHFFLLALGRITGETGTGKHSGTECSGFQDLSVRTRGHTHKVSAIACKSWPHSYASCRIQPRSMSAFHMETNSPVTDCAVLQPLQAKKVTGSKQWALHTHPCASARKCQGVAYCNFRSAGLALQQRKKWRESADSFEAAQPSQVRSTSSLVC